MSENDTSEIPPPKVDIYAPPAYSRIDYCQQNNHASHITHESTYNLHSCKLPTYEQVQLEKILNDEPLPVPSVRNSMPVSSDNMTFVAIENGGDEINEDSGLLGTDIVFVTAFFVSFIFNWIGFLMLTCFCNTIAGRYGGKIKL